MSEINARVRSSVRITIAATAASGIIQATTMVVLARLLGPTDYGFFVVALSINALAGQFLASATERAMVIERDAAELRGRAIPVTLIVALINAIAFLTAWLVRLATGWQIELGVLAIVLGGQAVGGLAILPRALLRRDIRFGPIVASEIAGLLGGNLMTAAILASLGFGAYSLAIATCVSAAITTGWMLALAPAGLLRPRWSNPGTLPGTVLGVLKPAALEALNGQVSPLVVSSVLGAVPLGLFNRIYNLVTLPIQLLVGSVNRILISMLVAVADNPDQRRDKARLVIRAGSALIAPLALGLAGSSQAFVAVMLGAKWLEAIPIVPLLAVAVWANMTGSILGQLAESVKRFNDKARVQAVSTTLLVLCLLAGSLWGISGVAFGYMTASLIFALLYLRLTASIVDRPLHIVAGWMTPGVLAGMGCYAVTRTIGWQFSGNAPAAIFVGQIGACGAVTLGILLATDRNLIATLSRLFLPMPIDRRVRRLLAPRQAI